jgi:hypothetical protein
MIYDDINDNIALSEAIHGSNPTPDFSMEKGLKQNEWVLY